MRSNAYRGWWSAPVLLVLGAVLLIGVVSVRSTAGVRLALPGTIDVGSGVRPPPAGSALPDPHATASTPPTVAPPTTVTPPSTATTPPPHTGAPRTTPPSAVPGSMPPGPTGSSGGTQHPATVAPVRPASTAAPVPTTTTIPGEGNRDTSTTVVSVSPDYPVVVSPDVASPATTAPGDP